VIKNKEFALARVITPFLIDLDSTGHCNTPHITIRIEVRNAVGLATAQHQY